MRWLFADPANPKESAEVRAKLQAIDRWWLAFQENQTKLENYLKRTTRWDLTAFMDDALLAVDSRLMYELGTAVPQAGHRMIITPQSARWLRPLTRTLLERAPKLAGWEFHGYRPAETVTAAIETVKARGEVDISGAMVTVAPAPGRKVELAYYFPDRELDQEMASQAAFYATEAILGEQVLDTWIGNIEVAESLLPGALSMPEAQISVANLVRGFVAQNSHEPTKNLAQSAATEIQIEAPESAEDYAGRDDIVSSSMTDLGLMEALYSGHAFNSACHSRLGETFCYLKLDAENSPDNIGQPGQPLPTLANGLNTALLASHSGCCFGTAHGLRYQYIELAITNLKQAVAVARQFLAEHKVSLNSWFLFHDDDLAAEWIGIYRETTAPLLALDPT